MMIHYFLTIPITAAAVAYLIYVWRYSELFSGIRAWFEAGGINWPKPIAGKLNYLAQCDICISFWFALGLELLALCATTDINWWLLIVFPTRVLAVSFLGPILTRLLLK